MGTANWIVKHPRTRIAGFRMSSPTPPAAVDVAMPQMGVSVPDGTVVEWHCQVGDVIETDQPLCTVSSDKVDTEVPSPVAGMVAEIVVAPGDTVAVGAVIARLAVEAPAGARVDESAPAATPEPARGTDGRGRLSPVARRIAAAHGLDPATIRGTGRGGRVTKHDVEMAAGQGTAETAIADTSTTETMSRMRQIIASRMTESQQTAATCMSWIEVDMGRVEAARRTLGTTMLPFVARGVVDALRAHPTLNSTLDGDQLTRYEDVNLGIAVSLGEDGLIVPVIRHAQRLSVEGLSLEIRALAERARAGSLAPDEMRGATFTITNPGGFGALSTTPIINQPQIAILDVGRVEKRAVVVTDADGNDVIGIRPMCIVGLAWDHRAMDGALAATFLATLKASVERLGAEAPAVP